MGYVSPKTEHSGLDISVETLDRAEALARWSALISSGYSGWAQWTSGVRRLNAHADLPGDLGILVAGECYLDQTTYRLSQQGQRWSLTKMMRVEGNEYLVVTRDFIRIEPPVSGSAAPAPRDKEKVRYELYWPAKYKGQVGDELSSPRCDQVSATCARLIQF